MFGLTSSFLLLSIALLPASSSFQESRETGPAAPISAALFDELELLYPDSSAAGGSSVLHSDSPQGVPVAVHLLIHGLHPARGPLQLSVRDGADLVSKARWFRLLDVPVEENTGLGSRTEQFEGKRNPFVVRRAPFRVYEAFLPIQPPLEAAGPRQALRLEIPVEPNASPGRRLYRIDIHQGNRRLCLHWQVEVHEVLIPPAGRNSLYYTNWFNPVDMAGRHGVEPWSEAFWPILADYAKTMADGRQNTFWLRWADFFYLSEEGTPALRESRLQKYIEVFQQAGLYWLEGAPLARRPGGDWSSPILELNVVKVPATGVAGQKALATMLGSLHAFLDRHQLTERWLQHLADEPTDTNAADYRKLAQQVRRHLPGVRLVEATMSRELAGALDIWCPQVHRFQQNRAFFERRKAEGESIWVYTCLVPGGPWLNRLLDQERLRPVYVGWAAAKYDLDGFLHWGLNHYKADPFQQSVVDHPAQPKTKNKLPAGDTHILYPGPEGPLNSQRFAAHRIGLEDHEMLRRLKKRNPQQAADLLQGAFRAFDDYEKDVSRYREIRRSLLQALASSF
ncbi:MAG: DUF4091 domain-containing protein [Planctomycetota bacterium]|nr:MAG: DUF4091 domain-containing protein [Planctomycetota bacterium]